MPWGAIIGAVGSIAGGIIKGVGSGSGKVKNQKVDLQQVELPTSNALLSMYAGQMQEFPVLRDMTRQMNVAGYQDYSSLINQIYPGATSQIGEVSDIAQSYLKGQIPADVQSQIARATAQQATQGGYAGTGMAGALTSRDLGLTSMSLQQQGASLLSGGLSMAKSMVPGYINPAQLLFNPAQIGARMDQQAYYNNQVKNQNIELNAAHELAASASAQQARVAQSDAFGNMFTNLFGSGSDPSKLSQSVGGWLKSVFSGGGTTTASGGTTTTATGGANTGATGGSDTGSYAGWPF